MAHSNQHRLTFFPPPPPRYRGLRRFLQSPFTRSPSETPLQLESPPSPLPYRTDPSVPLTFVTVPTNPAQLRQVHFPDQEVLHPLPATLPSSHSSPILHSRHFKLTPLQRQRIHRYLEQTSLPADPPSYGQSPELAPPTTIPSTEALGVDLSRWQYRTARYEFEVETEYTLPKSPLTLLVLNSPFLGVGGGWSMNAGAVGHGLKTAMASIRMRGRKLVVKKRIRGGKATGPIFEWRFRHKDTEMRWRATWTRGRSGSGGVYQQKQKRYTLGAVVTDPPVFPECEQVSVEELEDDTE